MQAAWTGAVEAGECLSGPCTLYEFRGLNENTVNPACALAEASFIKLATPKRKKDQSSIHHDVNIEPPPPMKEIKVLSFPFLFYIVPPVDFATVEASYREIGDVLIFNISLPERLETDIKNRIQIGDEVTMVTRNISIFAAIDKNAIGSSRNVTVTAINQCQQPSNPFTVEASKVSMSGNNRHAVYI